MMWVTGTMQGDCRTISLSLSSTALRSLCVPVLKSPAGRIERSYRQGERERERAGEREEVCHNFIKD